MEKFGLLFFLFVLGLCSTAGTATAAPFSATGFGYVPSLGGATSSIACPRPLGTEAFCSLSGTYFPSGSAVSGTFTVSGVTPIPDCPNPGATVTGSLEFSTPAGDVLLTGFSGLVCDVPGSSPPGFNVTGTYTITGGSGQFAGATGSGTMTAQISTTTFPSGLFAFNYSGTINFPPHPTATAVSCSSSTFAPGDATVCTATVTDTASSGQTTPTGTVTFTSSGGGSFGGSPCTLSGSGASASCQVVFTSFARGGHFIEASYGGDATHSASSAIAGVTIAVPVSTAGCVVFGHGGITAANGDRASFRGLVAATPPRGVEFYRDNGPANAMRVASTSVDALTCTDDATKASVFGTARVKGAGSVEYRIDVQLTAWERGKDTYRIRLSTGYDSGAQKIRHGDVDIRNHSSEHHHHDANAVRSS